MAENLRKVSVNAISDAEVSRITSIFSFIVPDAVGSRLSLRALIGAMLFIISCVSTLVRLIHASTSLWLSALWMSVSTHTVVVLPS